MIRRQQFAQSMCKIGPSVAVLSAAMLCFSCPVVAQNGFDGPGRYEITNLKSGKVLDLDRNDQTTVIQFTSRGTDNQVWDITSAGSGFYFLRNSMNGNALDASGDGNSTPVRGTRFTGDASQQWRFDRSDDGNALIVSRLGKALDIPNGTTADGARVHIYDANGDSNQRFTFRRVSANRAGSSGGLFGSNTNTNMNTNTITCSSDNGQRVYCDADTRGGVRMVRRLSGSQCQEGSTWGYDARGVWVDRGCRAEFDVSANRSGAQTRTIIGAGTSITVRTNEPIQVNRSDGRVFTGVVDQDVIDGNGQVAIPRGATAELLVKNTSNRDLVLDLESIDVNGQRYAVNAGSDSINGGRDGLGANKRTGEYVGGGALIGSIIGALAGGGKGAAIGAAVGAGAGAGTQVLTRGRTVRVPAESLLTFRLDQPIEMGARDYGVTRNGRHYHQQPRQRVEGLVN